MRLRLFADKYLVRDYVRAMVGDEILFPQFYAVYDRWQDITLDGLPPSFVMKPNHGSGWIMFVQNVDSSLLPEIKRLARIRND